MPFHKDTDGVVVFMSEEEKLRLREKERARYKMRPVRSAVGLVAAYYAAKAKESAKSG